MKNTFRWILMLAIGKSEAINRFPNTSNAVLRAMLWWVAGIFIISLITCFILSFSLSNNTSIIKFFIAVFLYKFCCLLLAAVFIHLCAIFLNKEGNWKKTVTACYWCDWIPSVAYVAIFMIAGLFFEERSNISESWSGGGQILREIYRFWLNWVVIRHGLKTTAPKAIVIQSIFYILTCVLYYIYSDCNHDFIEYIKRL